MSTTTYERPQGVTRFKLASIWPTRKEILIALFIHLTASLALVNGNPNVEGARRKYDFDLFIDKERFLRKNGWIPFYFYKVTVLNSCRIFWDSKRFYRRKTSLLSHK